MNKYMNIKIILFILFLSVFIVGCSTNPIPEKYSWGKSYAKVLETGDLEWAPEPFVFESGNSVRYIKK